MKVTFNLQKRSDTLRHRGLDMAEAGQVFHGPSISIEDDRRDYGEKRWITVGYLATRMVVLVWTEREGSRRIISMRKANDREQALYGPRLGRS